MNNLNFRAWLSVILLALVMGLLLFATAGSLRYWQAWVFLAVFFGACSLVTQYLIKNDRALLERRMRGGPTAEKQSAQKIIMLFASIGFIALLVVPALDHRFGWTSVPVYVVVLGNVFVAAGLYITFLVYRENSYSSATIQIVEGQKVISTGPYALVRHPMYAGGSLYLLGLPLALASYWGLVPLVLTLPFLIWRLFDEEALLAKNLPGYADYQNTVRWRLVPGIF